MEWVQQDLRVQRQFLTLDDVPGIFHGICKGLAYIHEQGFTHRDFKPGNILVDICRWTNRKVPKICDFGVAIKNNGGPMHGFRGTILYAAPEMILNKTYGISYTNAVDTWSLGVILLELVTGKPVAGTGLHPKVVPTPDFHAAWVQQIIRSRQQEAPQIYQPLLAGLLSEESLNRWTAEWAKRSIERLFPQIAQREKDLAEAASANGVSTQESSQSSDSQQTPGPMRKRQKTRQKSPGSSQDADGETLEDTIIEKGKQLVRD